MVPTRKKTIATGVSLRFYRERKNWSQIKLEEEAGVADRTVTNIENSNIAPHIKTLFNLAEALGLNNFEAAHLVGVNMYSDQTKGKKKFKNPHKKSSKSPKTMSLGQS